MVPSLQGEQVTRLLQRVQEGDREAEQSLIELVYPELKRLAVHLFNRERKGHTLQPTAVVNEAYLRLLGRGAGTWRNRTHFFAVASLVMRRLLVDHARKQLADKRGAFRRESIRLADRIGMDNVSLDLVLLVDEALMQLQTLDSRQAQVVQFRFFGGLGEQEIAEILGVDVRTVRRDWKMAKAWLKGSLGHDATSARA